MERRKKIYIKLNQINEAHYIHTEGRQEKEEKNSSPLHPSTRPAREDYVFSVQLLTKKVVRLNEIKEAQNILAQGRQERMMLYTAITARTNHKAKSNQGSTYHSIKKPEREDDFFM